MRSSLFEFYKFENGGTERRQTFCYPKTNFLKPLQLQQIFLDLQPLGVAGQAAICANDPVAGHHDAKWVAVAGAAYGAAGLGFAQCRRQLPVGAHLPVGNLAQLRLYRLLKGRALCCQRQVELPAHPGKIFVQLLLGFL